MSLILEKEKFVENAMKIRGGLKMVMSLKMSMKTNNKKINNCPICNGIEYYQDINRIWHECPKCLKNNYLNKNTKRMTLKE